jgi:hypothetical protein
MALDFHQNCQGLGAGSAVRKTPSRAISPAVGPGHCFNQKARFCCRFAAGAAMADRRRNYLSQLAATEGAGSVYIPRAGRLGCVIRSVARVPYRKSWSMRRRSKA